jgi:geranylgeranyl reductase family protein
LTEKAHFPRDKVCGDAVAGRAIGILRKFNLLSEVERLPGIRMRGAIFRGTDQGEADIDLSDESWRGTAGYVIAREQFDAFMFEKARRAAAECREGWQVEDLVREDNTLCGVMARDLQSGNIKEFRGDIVLGADGYKSVISQRLGHYEVDPRHWLVAARCYYGNVAGLRNKLEFHYINDILPGYLWIFPLGKEIANVGIIMPARSMKKRRINLVKTLNDALRSPRFAHRFKTALRLTKPSGWHLPVGSKRRPCAGAGYMLLGDAAGVIDPFSGEGIANAMYSACKALEIARAACSERNFGVASLSRYGASLWRELGPELALSGHLQKIACMEWAVNFIIRKVAGNRTFKELTAAMIREEAPRTAPTSPIFYWNLLFK